MTSSAANVPAERVSPPEQSAAGAPPPAGRWTAWIVTWVAYATYYLGRKGLSITKAPIAENLGKDVLVGVDTAYLAAYAVGQYVNGFLGDRVEARKLISVGMLISAVACIAFGASSLSIAFLLAFLVNGFAQSTGWPGNVKAMAEWTTAENRYRVMGVWTTCYQIGGFVATLFATWLLGQWGWRSAYWAPAIVIAVVGVMVFILLKPGPGAKTAGSAEQPLDPAEEAARKAERRQVLRSPAVWCYGASYFGMKLIRYSILFWLPFYLKTALSYSGTVAGYMSNSFELGGVLGTIGMGILSDRNRRVPRSVLAATWLVLLAGALFMYARIGATSMVANFVIMAFVGALLFGPDTLISGAAAQDAGGRYAAATAAGVVNGIGSIGAIFQEYVTRDVTAKYGWDKLFYVFVGLALFSAVALVPTFKTRAQPKIANASPT